MKNSLNFGVLLSNFLGALPNVLSGEQKQQLMESASCYLGEQRLIKFLNGDRGSPFMRVLPTFCEKTREQKITERDRYMRSIEDGIAKGNIPAKKRELLEYWTAHPNQF